MADCCQAISILKPLFEMDKAQRTRSHVGEVARILDRHPATIYRWIDAHDHSERVLCFCARGGPIREGVVFPKKSTRLLRLR